jgi:hypothetical protein
MAIPIRSIPALDSKVAYKFERKVRKDERKCETREKFTEKLKNSIKEAENGIGKVGNIHNFWDV